jgi:hypothetical protein
MKAKESSTTSNVHRFLTIVLLLPSVLTLAAQTPWKDAASQLPRRDGTNTATVAQSDSLVSRTYECIEVPLHLRVMRHVMCAMCEVM